MVKDGLQTVPIVTVCIAVCIVGAIVMSVVILVMGAVNLVSKLLRSQSA